MSFERLEEICRDHFFARMYPEHKIHMSADLSAKLMQRYQPPEAEREIDRLRDSVFGAPLLYNLMSMPVIHDCGIGDPTLWILVDATGEEVERGHVPYTCDEYGTCIFFKGCSNFNNCAEVEHGQTSGAQAK